MESLLSLGVWTGIVACQECLIQVLLHLEAPGLPTTTSDRSWLSFTCRSSFLAEANQCCTVDHHVIVLNPVLGPIDLDALYRNPSANPVVEIQSVWYPLIVIFGCENQGDEISGPVT